MATDEDLYDEMDAFVAGDVLDVPTEDLPPAEDAEQANRYLRARARLLRDAERVADVVDAEVRQLHAFRDDRVSGIAGRVAHLERLLEGWMRAVNEQDPRRKTESLPHGELRLRSQGWRVEVLDEAALVAWLEANDPALVNVEKTPRAGDLKAAVATDPAKHKDRPLRIAGTPVAEGEDEAWWEVVTGDGEKVPGVRFAKERRDRFTVR